MESNNNTKAMREALKMFVDAYSTTSYTLCIENLRPAFQKAKAALAKPPRNCDIFKTESKRRAAFIAYFNEAYDLEGSKYAIDTYDLNHNADGILHDYIEWLFAPAEEGETNGSK